MRILVGRHSLCGFFSSAGATRELTEMKHVAQWALGEHVVHDGGLAWKDEVSIRLM